MLIYQILLLLLVRDLSYITVSVKFLEINKYLCCFETEGLLLAYSEPYFNPLRNLSLRQLNPSLYVWGVNDFFCVMDLKKRLQNFLFISLSEQTGITC